MRQSGLQSKSRRHRSLPSTRYVPLLIFALLGPARGVVKAQSMTQEELTQQIQKLSDAMARTQSQIEQSQRDMEEMRRQLSALQQQVAKGGGTTNPPSPPPSPAPPTVEALNEKQAMDEAQIATHEQTKVESDSKYPVKINGLLLFNGFVNTSKVDIAATPTVALGGPGSSGASIRQTRLGIEARGPHLLGARSYGDISADFNAYQAPAVNTTSNAGVVTYSNAYNENNALLRLRTAHAGLNWERTQAYFSYDRPILNPDYPDSLTAVSMPPLAWSGNLWAWNPQVGVAHNFSLSASQQLRLEAALIDAADAPLVPLLPAGVYQRPSVVSTAERSRWPGAEARIAWQGSRSDESTHFGVGGYFSPHRTSDRFTFDAWAATADYRLSFPARLSLVGSAYRGLALGGLGAGGYKDYVYGIDSDSGWVYHRALDDVGGWSQLKERVNERLEFNAAIGIDELFAKQLRPYAGPYPAAYQNLARNRTFTGNVIFSPSAYLLFSLEYRYIVSSPVVGSSAASSIIGLGAGYKF